MNSWRSRLRPRFWHRRFRESFRRRGLRIDRVLDYAAVMWTSHRILKELADSDRRRRILSAFWRYAEPSAKLMATALLARALHFREESFRKMPIEKKADLLGARAGSSDFDHYIEMALMQYHTHEKNEMMAAFLDRWQVPHTNGSIEAEDYAAPGADQVREAVRELAQFDQRDVAVYLAAAGLLMAEGWRESTWPVVDEMAPQLR